MSGDLWSMEMMKKYRLSVDFCDEWIETPGGYTVYWGVKEEFATFESALQHVVIWINQ